MIDELAKAIWFASALNLGERDLQREWDEFSSGDREIYYTSARAVLSRLQDPTPEMIAAGDAETEQIGPFTIRSAESIFRAMLDAAEK